MADEAIYAQPFEKPEDVEKRRMDKAYSDLDNLMKNLKNFTAKDEDLYSEVGNSCYICRESITGQVVSAVGKDYHVACFCCVECKKSLGTSPFHEHDGNVYCPADFAKLFAVKCAHCDQVIEDSALSALGKNWHTDHFVCNTCNQPFVDGIFFEKDGKPYCQKDYAKMFAVSCDVCRQPVLSDAIVAGGHNWHPECFVCFTCKQRFPTGEFFEMEGKPFCSLHYHERQGSLCKICHSPLDGRCVSSGDATYHSKCFTCVFCFKGLTTGFKEKAGKAYCPVCFVKLFG
eukprot:m.33692 g.33692  ORF g.33692 m.33692 type:complete len:287 (+) comp12933_c0_seq1:68-928(+)